MFSLDIPCSFASDIFIKKTCGKSLMHEYYKAHDETLASSREPRLAQGNPSTEMARYYGYSENYHNNFLPPALSDPDYMQTRMALQKIDLKRKCAETKYKMSFNLSIGIKDRSVSKMILIHRRIWCLYTKGRIAIIVKHLDITSHPNLQSSICEVIVVPMIEAQFEAILE